MTDGTQYLREDVIDCSVSAWQRCGDAVLRPLTVWLTPVYRNTAAYHTETRMSLGLLLHGLVTGHSQGHRLSVNKLSITPDCSVLVSKVAIYRSASRIFQSIFDRKSVRYWPIFIYIFVSF